MLTPLETEIADRVESWRRSQGWSKAELARRIGMSKQALNARRTGILSRWRLSELERIATLRQEVTGEVLPGWPFVTERQARILAAAGT